MEHSNEPILAEVIDPVLQTHWGAIQAQRTELVEVLDQMASSFPKEGRKRLNSLSQWFSVPRQFDESLVRADVLAVCLPLSDSLEVDGKLGKSDIVAAAHSGFCSTGQNSGSNQLVRALAYPAIVLIGVALVAICLSVFVVPEFEEMFQEFGIELPGVTLFMLNFAEVIRNWSWILAVWLASAIGIVWFLNGVSRRRRPDGLGWLDLWMQTSRTALADWAWHLSLLLEAGLSQSEAIRKAGQYAGKSWLRASSRFWADGEALPKNTMGNVEDTGVAEQRYLRHAKYRLLDHALAVPSGEGKIQLLREVVHYYRDRNRNIGLWWIEWFVAVLLWVIGFVIIIFVISMFSPLLAIVSGLTGALMP